MQWQQKWDSGFIFTWAVVPPPTCPWNNKKMTFIMATDATTHLSFGTQGQTDFLPKFAGSPGSPNLWQNRGTHLNPSDLADDTFHRFTIFLDAGSAPNAGDGVLRIWIDGVLTHEYPGQTFNAASWDHFTWPVTFNGGAAATESEWLDDLRIWARR